MDLILRPENLTRQEPSRLAVVQTLGGGWVDDFDRGLSTITIAGHLGWRGGFLMSGEDAFLALRDTVYVQWHRRRQNAIAAGQDPGGVQLVYSDSLDSIASVVVPRSFQLQRSKTSPLLLRYSIQLVELGDASDPGSIIDQIINAMSDPMRFLVGITGLGNAVTAIEYWAGKVQAFTGAVLAGIQTFVNMGVSLVQSIASTAESLRGQFDSTVSSILAAGQLISGAAANAFYALGADPSLSEQDLIPVRAIAASFNDVVCLLTTSFNAQITYPSWSDLFGASACSSTGGGEAPSSYMVSNTNPFYDAAPSPAPPVLITPAAQAALQTLGSDPIALAASGSAAVGSLLQAAGNGVTVQ